MLIPAAAYAKRPEKLSADLDTRDPAALVDVIVQFNSTPTESHHKKVRNKGGQLKTDLSDVIRGSHYAIPAAKLAELSDDPDVTYISPDRQVRGSLDFATPAVGANIARSYNWTGAGIGIAVIDSGITVQTDLKDSSNKSRIVYSQSFLPSSPATADQYGHGTHVAGILAGNAASSTRSQYTRSFWGVAPKSESDQSAPTRCERVGQ